MEENKQISRINRNLILQSPSLAGSKAYWFEKLTDHLANGHFRLYHDLTESFTRSHLTMELPPSLSQHIMKFSKQSELGAFIFLVAGLKILMYKYGDGEAGAPVLSPLYRPGIHEETLGTYVILNDQLTEEQTVRELLLACRETITAAYEHQDYPAEEALAQVYHLPALGIRQFLPDVICSLDTIHTSLTKEEVTGKLCFQFTRSETAIIADIWYDPVLYDPGMVSRLPQQLVQVFSQMIANHQQALSNISLLSEEEKKNIIQAGQGPKSSCNTNVSVIAAFGQHVHATPGKIALLHKHQQFTYSQLDTLSNELAVFLQQHYAVQLQDRVVVLLQRTAYWAAAVLAIWKMNAIYIPVDPAYPEPRIRHIIEESACQLIIDKNVIEQFTAQQSNNQPLAASGIQPGDLAYIIYTSGSTGQPKGAMIEHAGMLNHLRAKIKDLAIVRKDVVAQNASHCFDISIWQLLAPLMAGATVCLMENELSTDPVAFLQLLQKQQLSIVEIVPSVLPSLLDILKKEPAMLDSVRYLLLTGEALKPALVQQFHAIFPHKQLINAYGPSEAADDITQYFINPNTSYQLVPVGRPLQNMNIYILDRNRQLCPAGVRGELYVSGIGVGRGYWNDAVKTAAAFMEDPFRSGESLRMYKTGDMARMLPDGNFEFLGRNDQQIKIRGYRIELQEIETVLNKLSDVKDAVVLAVQTNNDLSLCAYLITTKETPVQLTVLKQALRQLLPAYMVPDQYILIDQFPLTPNGKVDRRLLQQWYETGDNSTVGPAGEPVNDMQRALVNVWERMLEKHPISIHDNFFDLGGHSLTATRIVIHVRSEMGIDITINDIFDHPVIDQLSRLLEQRKSSPYTALQKAPVRAYYELSHMQRTIWIAQMMGEHNASYNILRAVEITGALNIPVLQQALNKVIAAQESLRTVFINLHGEPRQLILPSQDVQFTIDIIQLQEEDANGQLTAECAKVVDKAFDLQKWPLLQIAILRKADLQYYLLLNIHHIVADGWSMGLIVDTIFNEYNQLISGFDRPIPTPSLQHKDYVFTQQEWQTSGKLNASRTYWINEFSDIPAPLDLPADFIRPAIKSFRGNKTRFIIDKQQRKKIETVAKAGNASFFMFLFSTLYILLHRYTSKKEIVIGTPVAGRHHPETENMLGLLMNVLPIRITIEEEATFSAFLQTVRQKLLLAYEHQDYGYQQWVEQLDVENTAGGFLFTVMMVLQNQIDPRKEEAWLQGLHIKDIELPAGGSKMDLLFDVVEGKDNVEIEVEYSADLFRPETIERMLQHFREMINNILADPGRPISKIEYLSDAEKTLIATQFSRSTTTIKHPVLSIPAAWSAIVQTYPHKTAVAGRGSLTYQDLDDRINDVTNLLNLLPQDNPNIVVLRRRSNTQPAIMLGIFATGRCYIPLDPDWPRERLLYAIRLCQPAMIFTDSYTTEIIQHLGHPWVDPDTLIRNESTAATITAQSTEPAFIIYTSGSTGTPKAVVQTYDTLYNLMGWMLQTSGIDTGSSLLQYTSFAFDVSLQDMLFTLLGGGILHITSENIRMDTTALAAYIQEAEIEVLSMPYSILTRVIAAINEAGPANYHIKHIITAGEQPHLDTGLREFLRVHPIPLHNHYGPSETHVVTAYTHIDSQISETYTLPIGKPLPGFEIRILDTNLQQQGIGIPGELYFAGAGLFNGYLNDQALTQEKIRIIDGQRWYRSGDLGRWMNDGNIRFLGRADNQVKLHGFRIELGEIEHLLLQINGIRQAAAVVRKLNQQDILIAFYQSTTPTPDDEKAIREQLATQLPYYMIPELFIQLDKMPVNENGKLDRSRLQAIDITIGQAEPIAPSTPLERQLKEIWEEVLNRSRLGIHDNFFYHGGQSLKATRMMILIDQRLQIQLTLTAIFTYPTIAGLARFIESLEDQSGIETQEVGTPLKTIRI